MALGRGEMSLAIIAVLCLSAMGTEAYLKVGFYSYSCPKAEEIVKEELDKALQEDKGIGSDLLRMHFHDCFVRVSSSLTPYLTCLPDLLRIC